MEQSYFSWEAPRRTFTVAELTAGLREVLSELFTDIWVSGEISGTRLPPSGHYYFTLKDEIAQLKCVCYKSSARYLKFKPQDGVAVLARGRMDVYDARGEVQFIVESIEPQGFGALQLAFEQLKKKLAAEGLFDPSRKRALPPLPTRIGIVTSPGGAVIQDMLNIIERRSPGRHIRIFPAQVQGEGSVEQVAAGINYFSRSDWADVVIVARGGGSLEDLWTFNEERVARAIAESSVPVVSAIGHETDFTIADFVADLRAPTPSAAAEIVTATRQSLIERLETWDGKLRSAIRLAVALRARRLREVGVDSGRLLRILGRRMQTIDDNENRMRESARSILRNARRSWQDAHSELLSRDVRLKVTAQRARSIRSSAALVQSMRLQLAHAKSALAQTNAHLVQLSPLKILDRGYAIADVDGKIVKSAADAPVGSRLRIRLAKDAIAAKVLKS